MTTTDDHDPENSLVTFRIVLNSGITITGMLPEHALARIIRDPSDLSSVVHEIPAGSAVAIVLPPSVILEYSEGDLA